MLRRAHSRSPTKIIRAVDSQTDKETGAVLEGAVFELQQKVGDTTRRSRT
jgi:uncharacterized surface anchored protein